MEKEISFVDYKTWKRIIIISQISLEIMILLAEVVNIYLQYRARVNGYNPNTIMSRIDHYLFLPQFINLVCIVVSYFVLFKSKNVKLHKLVFILSVEIMCISTIIIHYQYSVIIGILAVPLTLTILCESIALSNLSFIMNLFGCTVVFLKRNADDGLNNHMGPESAIAYMLLLMLFCFAHIILGILKENKKKMAYAFEQVEKSNKIESIADSTLNLLMTLVKSVDAKDTYTEHHSLKVAKYAMAVAREIGESEDDVENLRMEAILHDVGNVCVPDTVLNKPSRLTDDEFALLKQHTVIGYEILKNLINLPSASIVAKNHHERYDGKGYPSGLKGENIDLHSRIIAVCDSYDAMSTNRVYREALPDDFIREQLIAGKEKQYDPKVVDIFLELLDEGAFEEIKSM